MLLHALAQHSPLRFRLLCLYASSTRSRRASFERVTYSYRPEYTLGPETNVTSNLLISLPPPPTPPNPSVYLSHMKPSLCAMDVSFLLSKSIFASYSLLYVCNCFPCFLRALPFLSVGYVINFSITVTEDSGNL